MLNPDSHRGASPQTPRNRRLWLYDVHCRDYTPPAHLANTSPPGYDKTPRYPRRRRHDRPGRPDRNAASASAAGAESSGPATCRGTAKCRLLQQLRGQGPNRWAETPNAVEAKAHSAGYTGHRNGSPVSLPRESLFHRRERLIWPRIHLDTRYPDAPDNMFRRCDNDITGATRRHTSAEVPPGGEFPRHRAAE
jgi:hypothetical protein